VYGFSPLQRSPRHQDRLATTTQPETTQKDRSSHRTLQPPLPDTTTFSSTTTHHTHSKTASMMSAVPNKVSPTGTREIIDHSKVMRVSEENKQVLSAVEALLSLTPPVVQHPEEEEQEQAAAALQHPTGESSRIPTASSTNEPQGTTSAATAATSTNTTNCTTTASTTIVNLPYTQVPKAPRPTGTVSPCDSSVEDDHTHAAAPPDDSASTTYFEGSCDLWCPEDEECLSPLHCFMRKYCVEAFTAKAFDISTPKFGRSLGRSIAVGQVSSRLSWHCLLTSQFLATTICSCARVRRKPHHSHNAVHICHSSCLLLQLGIQCKWCKHRNYTDRQERAVCFPSTIKNIYHSIETWQRRHSTVCSDIPPWAKTQMINLMKCSRSGAGGRRMYWEESAKRLGMVDTDSGVRFFRPPGTIDPPPVKNNVPLQQLSMAAETGGNGNHMDMDGQHGGGTNSIIITINTTLSHPIVRDDDLDLQITGYLFCLLEQMESCYFSDEDRIGGRSKVKSCQQGYPGYVHVVVCCRYFICCAFVFRND
jgi:hypothetical protein